MGTSRSYSPPTGGGWPPLKRQVNQFGGGEGGEPGPDEPDGPALPNQLIPQQLLGTYLRVRSRGGGGGGGGGAGGGGGTGAGGAGTHGLGRAAARVGGNLGGFAARVAEVGLAGALEDLGLRDMVGRPASDVTTALVDRLAGPGSTMDASVARVALNKLRQELLGSARTFEDVERLLLGTLEQIQIAGLIVQFYGHYLYELFCRDFYEQLIKKVGREQTRRSIDSIRRTIFSSLRAKIAGRDPGSVNWRGAEGRQLAERILTETVAIFEVGA